MTRPAWQWALIVLVAACAGVVLVEGWLRVTQPYPWLDERTRVLEAMARLDSIEARLDSLLTGGP